MYGVMHWDGEPMASATPTKRVPTILSKMSRALLQAMAETAS